MVTVGTQTTLRLRNATVPGCLVGRSDDLVRIDLSLSAGRIQTRGGSEVDLEGSMVLPCFVDMHAHLDKGHIWPRAANPDGTFEGAISTVADDRARNWTAEDVAARMEFSLKCAYAHGTRAIRTHLDSLPPQDEITWPVFAEMRDRWAGRIDLQGVSLIGCDSFDSIRAGYARTADIVADHGGILGMVAYPTRDLYARLHDFLELAAERHLEVDLHVDETVDPDAQTLRFIANLVIETGFDQPVTVGHCCSLSTQQNSRAMETLDLVAKAGLNVVSLPMCNLYLQDRHADRTPRFRGVTLVHEMRARGIPVSFASDNTRDPFYAYGDMDMLEVMRQATRIAHLDHSAGWSHAFTTTPAKTCGFDVPSYEADAPADLIVFKARDWTELFSRPQHDRMVLRAGEMIDTTLPDYSELDHLFDGGR